jgi:hypothetical protein
MPNTTKDKQPPNVALKWLTFLLRMPVVRGSNLGPETGYPD